MKKPLAASNKLMQNYLSELLTEEQAESVSDGDSISHPIIADKQKLDKLLQQANVTNQASEESFEQVISVKSENKTEIPIIINEKTTPKDIVVEEELVTTKSKGDFELKPEKDYRKGSFQAMFFDVAGLLIAVPLIELGGIHNVEKTTSLMGKPDWFKGVMLHREDKINVVDTALWVMPEKCNDTLLNSLNYQYVIMLDNSHWGLMAEKLVDTVTLQQDDVKWLDNPDKRPWLAGLVKDRMCALLDVDELTKMLDDGANITQKTNK